MGFGLFGSSNESKTVSNTTVTDASANAAEGSLAASGGGSIVVNSVDPEVTRQAFAFGGTALASNTAVAGHALDTGLEAIRVGANLVPDFLSSQAEQTRAVLQASQQNTNLAQQYASQGAALARGASTGGASTVVESLKPIILAALAVVAAVMVFKRKALA